MTSTYTYSNLGNSNCPQDNFRLCRQQTVKGATVYQLLRYSYYNVGNVHEIFDDRDSNNTQTFGYDELNRLTSAQAPAYGTISYDYNEIGNMMSNSQIGSYNYPTNGIRPHAVTTAGNNSYIYDDNGNMTSGPGRTIRYDYDNRPVSVTAGGSTTTFMYDANGSRVKKTANGVSTIYIGKLYENTSDGCVKYIFAGDQRIAMRDATGALFYYHTDHLGSSSVVTNAAGDVVENLAYFPYGQIRINTGTKDVHYKFTGQELDAETGLYFYGARYYDPVLGRFISADSIVPDFSDTQAFNRYSYVRNNPIIFIDPSGHSWFSKSTSDFMDDILGIEKLQIGIFAGVGGEVSFDFRNDGIKAGGGVGVGVGFNIDIRFSDFDLQHREGSAATVGYDPNYGIYASAWAGCTVCGGASASAIYYFKSGIYQFGAGIGYKDFGVGVGYSNAGGAGIGGGYGGVGANYNLETHKTRYSVDPTGSLILGGNMTGDPNVQGALGGNSNVTYREGGLFIGTLQLFEIEGITLGSTIIGEYGRSLAPNFAGFMSHELVHVGQWNSNGYVSFATRYIADYAKNGYRWNQYEREARDKSGY